jgi:hypothetical protein
MVPGSGFLPVLDFLCQFSLHQIFHFSPGLVYRAIYCQVPRGSVSPQRRTKKIMRVLMYKIYLYNSSYLFVCIHVRWVHCHHCMARPLVADGGDALQVWRVAANILNKQSRTADKGWSSTLGVGRGANNYSPKKIRFL